MLIKSADRCSESNKYQMMGVLQFASFFEIQYLVCPPSEAAKQLTILFTDKNVYFNGQSNNETETSEISSVL